MAKTKSNNGLEHLSSKEKLRELGVMQPGEGKAFVLIYIYVCIEKFYILIDVQKYLKA